MTDAARPRKADPSRQAVNGQVLVSVATRLDAGLAELAGLWAFLNARYTFFELILVGCGVADDAMKDFVKAHSNVRVVMLTREAPPEAFFNVALEQCIGDCLVVCDPAYDDRETLPLLVDACMGKAQLVLVDYGHRSGGYGLLSRAYYTLLGGLTGQAYLAHSDYFAVNRQAMTHLLALPVRQRMVRFSNAQTGLPHLTLTLEPKAAPRRALRQGLRRIGQSLQLGLLQSERVAWAITLACLAVALVSFAFVAYALLMWLVNPAVASGWTSQMMVISGLFGVLFLVMGLVVQFLLVLLREVRQAPLYTVAGEMTHADLFRHAPASNVTRES